jgi:hypothetical protein
VATDNGDVLVGGVVVLQLGDEARGTDNVEGGDTEEALGVVDALGLEDLGGDGDGRVDLYRLARARSETISQAYRVGDDEDVGLGGVLSSGLGEVADDGGVGVEEVVTGHAGLAGDTSGDDNDLSALEGLGKTGGSGIVAADLRLSMAAIGNAAARRTSLLVLMWPMSAATPVAMSARRLLYMHCAMAYRARGGCRRGRAG